jgi:hypothetical protein
LEEGLHCDWRDHPPGQQIFLAGVDDPHFYRADDVEKAAFQIPQDAFSIYYRIRRRFTIARRVQDLM